MKQREQAGCGYHGEVWTKPMLEPNESVATIDQLFADIVKEVERTGGEQGDTAEPRIRMPWAS